MLKVKSRKSTWQRYVNNEDADFDNPELANADEMPIEDIIESEEAENELTESTQQLDEVREDVSELDAGEADVINQMEENEALLEEAENGGAEVTPEDAQVSTEALMDVCNYLGMRDVVGTRVSYNIESFHNNPRTVISNNQEALSDLWDKIKEMSAKAWEWVKQLLDKILDFFKKALPSRMNTLKRLEQALKNLDSSDIHKDVKDKWEDTSEDKFSALYVGLAGKWDASAIKDMETSITKTLNNFKSISETVVKFDNGVLSSPGIKSIQPFYSCPTQGWTGDPFADGTETGENPVKGETRCLGTIMKPGGKIEYIVAKDYTFSTERTTKSGSTILERFAMIATTAEEITEVKKDTSLSKSNAEKLVKDRIETVNKLDNALKNLKTKVNEVASKVNKSVDNFKTEVKDDEDKTKENKDVQKAAGRAVKSLQTLASACISMVSNNSKISYDYTVQYAKAVIDGVKQKKSEKDSDKK